jgi:hypothetical protein
MIAAERRRVVTLADGLIVGTVGSVVCNLRMTSDKAVHVVLKSITIHILPELAFDVILGFPTIRSFNLLSHFASLFSEVNLQVHNCTMCRQCLPAVYQQECTLTPGATQAEVLLAVTRSGTLVATRDSRLVSERGLM